MSTNSRLIQFIPKPHPAKRIIKQKGFSVAATARFLGCSLSHCYQILNGNVPLTPGKEQRLQDLIQMLEGSDTSSTLVGS